MSESLHLGRNVLLLITNPYLCFVEQTLDLQFSNAHHADWDLNIHN